MRKAQEDEDDGGNGWKSEVEMRKSERRKVEAWGERPLSFMGLR